MSLIIIKGLPALTWGSSNGVQTPAGAIIESARLTPKNGSPIDIEDNGGISANLVLLRDGFNGRISTMYDGNKVYPIEGANVGFNITANGITNSSYPFGEGNAASVTGNTVTYFCTLAAIGYNYSRKKELMIDWDLVYRPNVSP